MYTLLCPGQITVSGANPLSRFQSLTWDYCSSIKEMFGNLLQYSCLENPIDGGAWWATLVHGVAKSQTRLSDFTFTFIKETLEK